MEHPSAVRTIVVIVAAGYLSLLLSGAPWYAYLPITLGGLPTAIFFIANRKYRGP